MKRRAPIRRAAWLCALLVLALSLPSSGDERRQEQLRERERQERQDRKERERRQWRIKSVGFKGNDTYSDKELISLMDLKPKKWPNKKIRFTNYLMTSDIDVLRAFYRSRGFERAEVRLEKVDRDTVNRLVEVCVAVEEGPRTHVSEVSVASERYKLRGPEMRRLLTKPGAPLIHPDVRQDARTLKEILGLRGFLAASVDPGISIDSQENLARVTFNVTEGPRAAVGGIELEGNEHFRNSVFNRELTFKSGDTLNLKMVRNSERRLYFTGLFNYVQIKPMFDTTRAAADLPDSAYGVHVSVSKSDFFRLRGGVGFSTDEGFGASGSATYLNMFRLGHGLTLDGKLSQVSQAAELLYAIPLALLVPMQFDTKLYYKRYDNPELYIGEFAGVRLSLDRETDYNVFYQLWSQWERLQWVRAPEEQFPEGVPEYPTQSIGGSVGFDTRNDLFSPSKGSYTNIGLEVAGVFGGESNQFVKLTFDTRWYFSHRSRYFLSMALRTGWAAPYGESEVVPIQTKFYGGGGNTVRGFPVNKLAVLPNNDPLMGDFHVFWNVADIRFPIYWWVNGAVFLDAGNVWPDFSDISSARGFIGDLRWSAGPGLRVDTPIRLVARLDMGFKLDRRPGESQWELHFDLGQPF